ncbi:hypothetical protein [Glaciecola sp. KUL10]|uniref:DUF7010 family protein n=1 Tax=Glaciecola sp. (strain KUL10) TaxID=2161813 RepID=UPI000D821ADD|nr:hypothetical protein [Glaciecola sp. KUL10]GBL05025.1 hypothetical protein KUL10_23430 [Glaciecola sp. KUL10]
MSNTSTKLSNLKQVPLVPFSEVEKVDEMSLSLEEHRASFANRRFLALPLAGALVWFFIGASAPFISEYAKVMSVWLGTGCIFYLGLLFSRFTGENFISQSKQKNPFDLLFLSAIGMSLLVFGIAMPVAQIDHTTIPFTVGILAGLMWMVLSWIIQHWVGYAHAIMRTVGIVIAWYSFPEQRFESISAVIVISYVVSIIALEMRFRQLNKSA